LDPENAAQPMVDHYVNSPYMMDTPRDAEELLAFAYAIQRERLSDKVATEHRLNRLLKDLKLCRRKLLTADIALKQADESIGAIRAEIHQRGIPANVLLDYEEASGEAADDLFFDDNGSVESLSNSY
jgi:hypothetical protein